MQHSYTINSFQSQNNTGTNPGFTHIPQDSWYSHNHTCIEVQYYNTAFKSIFAIWKLLPSIFHSLLIAYKLSIIFIAFSLKLFKCNFGKGDISFHEIVQRQKGACYRHIKILLFYLASYQFSFLFISLMYICFGCSSQHRLHYWYILFTVLFSMMYVEILTNLFSCLWDRLQIIYSNMPGEKNLRLKEHA